MYPIIKKILFNLQPEEAHHFTMGMLKNILKVPGMRKLLRSKFAVKDERLKVKLFGLEFPNPVGLAAGFDKDARYYDELANLGFGFIEIGTVTPKPQPGNEKPRLFRLVKDSAIINRMGFNNEGVDAAVERLKNRKPGLIIGGNIGKNKVTANEDAISDYLICFKKMYDAVDYFTVNVSSPNTPGLRELQDKEPLMNLLNTLVDKRDEYVKEGKTRKSILLKIAPDLTDSQLDDIVDIIRETKTDGVISSNTTIDRSNLTTSSEELEKIGAGGLSGKPLTKRSTEVIRYLHTKSKGAFPIIGVGGIHTAQDAIDKLNAGASMVQLYTGFIYEGPDLIKNICKEILKKK